MAGKTRPVTIIYHIIIAFIFLGGIISVCTPWTEIDNAGPTDDDRLTLPEIIDAESGHQETRARFIMGSIIVSIVLTTIVLTYELFALYGYNITALKRKYIAIIFLGIAGIFYCASFSLYIDDFGNAGDRSYYTGWAFCVAVFCLCVIAILLVLCGATGVSTQLVFSTIPVHVVRAPGGGRSQVIVQQGDDANQAV